MSQVLDTMTTMLETEAALEAWDVPPWLGVLFESQGKVVTKHFKFSTQFWELAHPVVTVDTIAKAVTAIGLPDHLYVQNDEQYLGVVLFNEGWAISFKPDDPDAEEKHRAAHEHTINEHEDRIEMKIMSAVDRTGKKYMVQFARGQEHSDRTEGEDAGTLEGRVFDVLVKLERAVRDAQGEE